MKVLIVNRFFGGAQIPTGRMAEDVARVLAESGHEVTALASTGTYAGAEKQEQHGAGSVEQGAGGIRHTVDGIRLDQVRVPKWMPRALAWIWFTWQVRKRIPRMDWDVCVLMTDPPLLPLLAAKAASDENRGFARWPQGNRVTSDECGDPNQTPQNGTEGRTAVDSPKANTERPPHRATRRVAVWLMDLYPEALAASGRLSERNPIYRWYLEKRQRALAAADLLICLGHAQKKLLGGGRVARGAWSVEQQADSKEQGGKCRSLTERVRTVVVPPWDDRGNIALATEESLRNLALYAGNLGEAHCFEELLAAVPFLPGDWRIRFAVRGAKAAALRRSVQESGASARVMVGGYVSGDETAALLASARVHLITMASGWEGIVVPSKLYGCIRTGRPVLFIGPENADTAREIRAHDWGVVLPPGASGEKVAGAILELAARPTRARQPQHGKAEIAALIAGA